MSTYARRPSDRNDAPVRTESSPEGEPSSSASAGPFASPEINAALSESFGQSLDGIEVERGAGQSARALDAHAYTMGSKISLGDNVREDFKDARSMEIISHEVAHALGSSSNSKTRALDGGRESAGESAAHAASGSFRDFVAGGAQGPAPKLSAATGGDAQIHRFEAGEHADAVDSAGKTLGVDNEVTKLIGKPITLSNGVTVTQGQITAMMGDFYGAYTVGPDGKEHFDPIKAFEQLDNADPKEMEKIKKKIDEEKGKVKVQEEGGKKFEASDNAELEKITNDRHLKTETNADGTETKTGFTFMDLAQKNSNHFNGPNEKNADGTSNTDTNLGSYQVLHAAAMKAAQDAANLPPGTDADVVKKAQAKALALEASSQHFETDRFSSGHQFDKDQLVKDNTSWVPGSGTTANIKARIEHDKYNDEGVEVHDENGKGWLAKGDSHWADDDNKENREQTAKAVLGSYGDINDILSGKKKSNEIDPEKASHTGTPVWDPAFNDKVQKEAKGNWYDAGNITPSTLWDQRSELPLIPAMIESWGKAKWHTVEDTATDVWNAGGKAVDWAEQKGGQALDWAEKKGSEGLNWAEKKGSEGLNWAEKKGGEALDAGGKALDWAEKKGSEGLNWAEKKGTEGLNWAEKKGGEALDAGGKAIDWAEKKGSEGLSWAEKKGSEGLNWAEKKGSEAVDFGEKKIGEGVDWAEKKGGEALQAGGQAIDWAGQKAAETGTAISTGAGKAWDATTGAIGNATNWAGDQAEAAKKAFSHWFD